MDVASLISLPRNLEILGRLPDDLQCFGKWFLAISEIPHPTFHTDRLSSAICAWFTVLNVPFEQDAFGNICARIPANGLPDTAPVTALQSHIDMVSVGEFLPNGAVEVSLQDRLLIAEKSTLGADDAVGLALMFEISERRTELTHGPMEFIFTVDEEQGMGGVKKLPRWDGSSDSPISPFKSKYLINCDVLDWARIHVGSSGANIYRIGFRIHPAPVAPDKAIIELSLSNLKGGHSGGCIGMNRLNAIKVLARIMKSVVAEKIGMGLVSIDGGEQMNIIPRFARAKVAVSAQDTEQAVGIIEQSWRGILKETEGTDESEPVFEVKNRVVTNEVSLNIDETVKIVNVLLVYQNGPIRMSPTFEGMVDTSDNLAVVKTDSDCITIISFPRSVIQTKLDETDQRIRAICELSGLECELSKRHAGAPWPPKLNSGLARLVKDSFEAITGVRKQLGFTQVTIEPSEFLALGYDMDMVSVCPSVPKAHTIGEFVDIDECVVWRKVILDVLPKLIT
jgi:dipeptidase D